MPAEWEDPDGALPPKSIVRTGWDRVSEVYRPDDAPHDRFGHTAREHADWLRPLLERLPRRARVVDLGCGCGVPDCALLVERFEVTGVDISDVQIARARRLVPRATFLRADMTEVTFPSRSVAGVVCLYALIHVPLREQHPLLARIRDWLVPGGLFLVVTGREAYTGVESDWLGSGSPMYWSHADAATYARWFRETGFEIEHEETVPEGEATSHELFLLRAAEL